MKAKYWKVFLKLTITFIIIFYIFKKIDLKEIIDIDIFHFKYFLFALILIPIRLFIKSLRWQAIMRKSIPNIDLKDSIKSMLVGIALGLITPMRVGQAGIVTYIKSESNFKTGFLAFFEVLMDLLLIIITAGISFLFLFLIPHENLIFQVDSNVDKIIAFSLFSIPNYFFMLLALSLFCIALFSVLFLLKPTPFIKSLSFIRSEKISKLLTPFSDIKLYRNMELLYIIFTSLIIFLINLVQFLFLTYSFAIIPLKVVLIAFPLIILGVCLPLTIAGLGAREGVAAWIYASFGVASVVGIRASFLLFVINMVFPSIIGLIIYNLKGK